MVIAGMIPAQPASAATWSADLAALQVLAPGTPVSAPGGAGPFALKGVVTAASGRPVGAGVPVFLFAAPSQASTAELLVGQRVEFPLVAATVTDPSGAYMFPQAGLIPALTSIKSEFQQVVVPTLTQAGTRAVNLLQAEPAAQGGTVVGGLMAASITSGTMSISTGSASSLATHNGTLTLPGSAATAAQLKAAVVGVGGVQPANYGYCNSTGVVCYYETLEETWYQHVIVGETASKMSGAWAQLAYTQGSSSSLGMGVSSSGSAGSYSQNATTSVSNSSTVTFAKRSGNHDIYYRTDFTYGKYRDEVYTLWIRTSLSYLVKPTGQFAGGNYSVGSSGTLHTQSPSYCRQYLAGDQLTKSTTKATTWSNGVSIGTSDVKVNLSAQTGYTSTMKVTYGLTSTGYLCGIYAPAASTSPAPGVIYASATAS